LIQKKHFKNPKIKNDRDAALRQALQHGGWSVIGGAEGGEEEPQGSFLVLYLSFLDFFCCFIISIFLIYLFIIF
jgi:hypothetical protein